MAKEDGVISRKASILLLLTAALLSLPAIGILWTDDAARSHWENRELARFPRLTGAKPEHSGFFRGLETWINDHFGFAIPLNRLYRQMVYYVFSDSPASQITLGRDGFVFLNSHASANPNQALRVLCDNSTEKPSYPALAANWLQTLRRFERPGRNVVLAVAPTTPVIYPEMLPPSTPFAIRQACLNYSRRSPPLTRLALDIKKRGLHAVYPLEDFIAKRFDGNFYPKQSFHFSGAAAHLFSDILLKAVGILPPPMWGKRIDNHLFRADLETIFGFDRTFRAPDYDYSQFGIQIKGQTPTFINECYLRALDFGSVQTRSPMSERSALILSDSFGARTAPHLAAGYRNLVWINVTRLQPSESAAFVHDCLPKIPADDVFFVFHDAGALALGPTLRQTLSPPKATNRDESALNGP